MKNLPQADGVFDTVRHHRGFSCGQAFAGKVNSNSEEMFGGARRMLTRNDPSSAALEPDNDHPSQRNTRRLAHILFRENSIKILSSNDHVFRGGGGEGG